MWMGDPHSQSFGPFTSRSYNYSLPCRAKKKATLECRKQSWAGTKKLKCWANRIENMLSWEWNEKCFPVDPNQSPSAHTAINFQIIRTHKFTKLDQEDRGIKFYAWRQLNYWMPVAFIFYSLLFTRIAGSFQGTGVPSILYIKYQGLSRRVFEKFEIEKLLTSTQIKK